MDINNRISEIGVVPVIKLSNPQRDAVPLAKALTAGGIPVAEVTFRAAGADEAIRLMKEACPDMLVGAGPVLTTEHVDKAIAAGADINDIAALPVREKIGRAKSVPNDEYQKTFDEIKSAIAAQLDQLVASVERE